MAGASYNKPISSGTDTNANGEFRIPIIAGEFKVFTGMPGWMNDLQYMPPEELTVDISKGESLDVTLQFSQADSTIFGAVEFEDGSQVEFGFVMLGQRMVDFLEAS